MSRSYAVTLCILLASLSTPGPVAVKAGPARTSLPHPDDFPPAGGACRIKKTVYAHVLSRAVVFGQTTECSLQVYSCKPKYDLYRSEARPTKQNVCEDYYAAAAALTGREACCDAGEAGEQDAAEKTKSGEKPPPGKSGGEGAGKDTQGGATLDADLAVTIEAPQQYPLGVTPFAVTLVNRGPGPARAARLTGRITPGRLNSATTSTGTCSVSGGGFSCDFGTIVANETRSVSLQARTQREGKAQISAEARSATPDRITANNRARTAIEVKAAVKGTWSPPQQ